MEYISATDARASLSEVIDAAQKQPVVIRRQNKDVAVMISPQQYERLKRIHVQEIDEISRNANARAKAMGLTEEKLAEWLAADD